MTGRASTRALPCPLAGAAQCLRNEVDARDLPAALCELDSPDPAAAAEIERFPVGRLASFFLAIEQCGDLLGHDRPSRSGVRLSEARGRALPRLS